MIIQAENIVKSTFSAFCFFVTVKVGNIIRSTEFYCFHSCFYRAVPGHNNGLTARLELFPDFDSKKDKNSLKTALGQHFQGVKYFFECR